MDDDLDLFFSGQAEEPRPDPEDLEAFFLQESLQEYVQRNFLAGRIWMFAHGSTNVHAATFNPKEEILIVGYNGGRGKWKGRLRYYGYSGVNSQEAAEAWDALSKGVWTWDALRVRGTLRGTQKPVTFLGDVSEITPNWLLEWTGGEEGIPVDGN